ncbi:MAG: hypothetical protein JWQ02_3705 [Capsulimonas sp.]|nr:hypothetical protein [Capsulimonas sp.]
MERPDAGKNDGSDSGLRLSNLLRQTLSEDPHMTDSELIELSAGVIDATEAVKLWKHAHSCPECSAEIERLMGQSAVWDDPWEIERREARIERSHAARDPGEQPWWAAAAWAAISLLHPRRGALAADDDAPMASFPITDSEGIVAELSGVIQRRGNEYHVRITSAPGASGSYQNRWVEVVLFGQDSDDPLLRRKVPVDRFILLGTDLAITTDKITARLLS